MFNKIKKFIKSFTPDFALSAYHYVLATVAAVWFGHPSRKMIVIGITGTKGKTSAANFIWSCLTAAGYRVGLIGTANIRIGDTEHPNNYHMTMPGRFVLQRYLADMAAAKCRFAIVEATSEGMKLWRHKGIDFDIAIFTNLYPEHLQSHGGSFEEYKKAKGLLFASLKQGRFKTFDRKPIAKTIIADVDSPHANYYLNFPADKKITYGVKSEAMPDGRQADIRATDIQSVGGGVTFKVDGNSYEIKIPGEFNVENALAAFAVCRSLGISNMVVKEGLASLLVIPGRMEKIDLGQNFLTYVDYAHQKESMEALLVAADKMRVVGAKIILLLGAEGGGRDRAKRPAMGQLAGQLADFVVVSNVDPYEDDPTVIAEDIARAAEEEGKARGRDLFVIEDRRAGIKKALELARENDIVLITGKGSEQSIVIGGKAAPWDDRKVVMQELLAMMGK